MIGYGLAFVIGYLVVVAVRSNRGIHTYPWTPAPMAWGIVAMLLNWVVGKW